MAKDLNKTMNSIKRYIGGPSPCPPRKERVLTAVGNDFHFEFTS